MDQNLNNLSDIPAQSLAKDITSKNWYHGSPFEGLTPDMLSVHRTNLNSLVGPGVYLTDNPGVAQTYASHRGKLGSLVRNPNPTIYKADLSINGALDAEKEIPNYIYNKMTDILTDGDPEKIIEKAAQKNNTFANLYAQSKNYLSDLYQGEPGSMGDIAERLQNFFGELKQSGIDAIRYNGGLRTKNIAHTAVNIIDPNNELMQVGNSLKGNITKFNPVGTLQDIIKGVAAPLQGAFVPPFLNDAINDYKKNQDYETFKNSGA